MKLTRYTDDSTIGKVVSMRCRRSSTNPEVIVLDTEKLAQVYVYEQATLEGVMAYLRDTMNIDIRETDQYPVTTRLVNHQSTGLIFQIPHEDDAIRDDFHAFFLPLEPAEE